MPTYTLRPNANWTGAADWTITGGEPTVWESLDDNSDSTYVQKTSTAATGTSLALELTTTSLPADEKVEYLNVRIRMEQGTTGRLQASLGYIRDRNTKSTAYSSPIEQRGTIALSTVDYVINLTTAPDGSEWDQDHLDDAVVRLVDFGASTDRAKIYEVYVDVVTTTQPTLSLTGPTSPVTDTSFPIVTWTYSDTENDPQAAYQVKIFTAAQYGASGFNPETSTPTVTSGEILSSDAGYSLGTDLANNTTFRAYVKVAQQLNNTLYYSAWGYQQFTVTLDSPATPTLSAAYQTATRRVNITLQGLTNVLSENESSIETSAAGWTSVSNTTVARTTGQYLIGSASLSLTAIASADMIVKTANDFPVLVGQNYSALASFKAGTTGRTCQVGIRWLNSGGSEISITYGTGITDSSSGWTEATVSGAAPTGSVTAEVVLKVTSPTLAEVHYADKMCFHPGATPAFTVGGYTDLDFVVERSNDSGLTYTALRGSPVVANEYQSATLVDYESAVGGVATYRAKARGNI